MDNEIDRKIDVTAMLFLLVQNRQQIHDWTLNRSGANGLGILYSRLLNKCLIHRDIVKNFFKYELDNNVFLKSELIF